MILIAILALLLITAVIFITYNHRMRNPKERRLLYAGVALLIIVVIAILITVIVVSMSTEVFPAYDIIDGNA